MSPLSEQVPAPVVAGMWVGILTVTVLVIGVVVRLAALWSSLVNDLRHLVKAFDTHLADERRDRDERERENDRAHEQLERRIARAEKSIDDIRGRIRGIRPT